MAQKCSGKWISNMKKSDITASLILIPRTFHRLGNVSTYDLLKDTGYFEKYDQVSEGSIHEALKQHPECVDEWILYSQDKRTSTGWYFKREDENAYIVGYFAGKAGKNKNIQLKFTDRIEACAAFIKREAETMRQVE